MWYIYSSSVQQTCGVDVSGSERASYSQTWLMAPSVAVSGRQRHQGAKSNVKNFVCCLLSQVSTQSQHSVSAFLCTTIQPLFARLEARGWRQRKFAENPHVRANRPHVSTHLVALLVVSRPPLLLLLWHDYFPLSREHCWLAAVVWAGFRPPLTALLTSSGFLHRAEVVHTH